MANKKVYVCYTYEHDDEYGYEINVKNRIAVLEKDKAEEFVNEINTAVKQVDDFNDKAYRERDRQFKEKWGVGYYLDLKQPADSHKFKLAEQDWNRMIFEIGNKKDDFRQTIRVYKDRIITSDIAGARYDELDVV
jgi:hypothetical protein